METIRVNMTPCEDVQTIHASQNDNEAREWGFELHNNGDAIDSSEITDQMVFKAYEGGTEQILPENGSTPTTSPFLGDIRYPQGLLSDQEFLYRESPTEEDGLAKITDIKGNTLVWNQIYNVNNDRTTFGVNIKVVNGAVSITGTSTGTGSGPAFAWTDFQGVIGHKYIITKDFALPSGDYIFDQYNLNSSTDLTTVVFTLNNSGSYIIPQLRVTQTGVTYNISGHLCVYDLTKMFGAGNEPTTVDDFTSLFPLPYYAYNQGTLLSFNGNGIKTVGFNQWDEEWELGTYLNINGTKYNSTSKIRNVNPIRVLPNTSYYYMVGTTSTDEDGVFFYDGNMTFIRRQPVSHGSSISTSFTTPANCSYVNFSVNNTTYNNDICINISDPEKNGTYEPYTSSTLSLPISTYFSNGMKSAGSVYDELTETKAITRVGRITFNSIGTFDSSGKLGLLGDALDAKPVLASVINAKSVLPTYLLSELRAIDTDGITQYSTGFFIRLKGKTTLAEYNSYLSSNPITILYELNVPIEESIQIASLVTENAEIPLSNEDGVLVGKCTEQLSENPGFFDAKIKLSDSDGECYSNKIQLHIERSPQ